jgi:hypothetical protein
MEHPGHGFSFTAGAHRQRWHSGQVGTSQRAHAVSKDRNPWPHSGYSQNRHAARGPVCSAGRVKPLSQGAWSVTATTTRYPSIGAELVALDAVPIPQAGAATRPTPASGVGERLGDDGGGALVAAAGGAGHEVGGGELDGAVTVEEQHVAGSGQTLCGSDADGRAGGDGATVESHDVVGGGRAVGQVVRD